ncbi:hypothetical protein K227x_22840 [Rubripirellula lacrimiformis]|uniref:Uncharacterized protein n=1 Tax=Rubripirellula lacrimiformis TaxID=1930273 RepID=A0A517N9T8_9BACT|nr:hypothetical protein K227x_22840 [Rubripirellula lacrimiformis]
MNELAIDQDALLYRKLLRRGSSQEVFRVGETSTGRSLQ